MPEAEHQHHRDGDDEHGVAARKAGRARMLGHLKHLGGGRARTDDQVRQRHVPEPGQGRPRGDDPGPAVEDQDRDKDDRFGHRTFGVADPAEQWEGQPQRPP